MPPCPHPTPYPPTPTPPKPTGKHAPRGDLGTPLANDPRVREALELAIDREAFNQVVWEGQYTPGCTPLPPVSPYYDKSRTCPVRAGRFGRSATGAKVCTRPPTR